MKLYGDRARIVGFAGAPDADNKNPGTKAEPGLLSVVAGGGFEPPTFRL